MTGLRKLPSPRSGTHGEVGALWAQERSCRARAEKTPYPTAGRLVVIPTADYRGPRVNSAATNLWQTACVPCAVPQTTGCRFDFWPDGVVEGGCMRMRLLRWLAPALFVLASPSLGYAGTINIPEARPGRSLRARHQRLHRCGQFFSGPIGGFYGSDVDVNLAGPVDRHDRLFRRRSGLRQSVQPGRPSSSTTRRAHDFAESRLAPGHVLGSASWPWPVGVSLRHPQPYGTQLLDGINLDNSCTHIERAELLRLVQSVQRRVWSRRTTCDRLWIFLDDSGVGPAAGPTMTTTTWCCG